MAHSYCDNSPLAILSCFIPADYLACWRSASSLLLSVCWAHNPQAPIPMRWCTEMLCFIWAPAHCPGFLDNGPLSSLLHYNSLWKDAPTPIQPPSHCRPPMLNYITLVTGFLYTACIPFASNSYSCL